MEKTKLLKPVYEKADGTIALCEPYSVRVSELLRIVAVAEKELDVLLPLLRAEMENRSVKSLENKHLKVRLGDNSVRWSLDTSRLKLESPETYERYKKPTDVKGQFKVEPKDED